MVVANAPIIIVEQYSMEPGHESRTRITLMELFLARDGRRKKIHPAS